MPDNTDIVMREWTEAWRNKADLQAEISHATHSRFYGDQVALMQAARAAEDRCNGLLLRLRVQLKYSNEALENKAR